MKLGLAFSGGRDSWACLWLNKDRLSEITILWVNTGKNYPELLATIDKAKALCQNFVEIVVDRDAQNAAQGLPVDVLPMDWTVIGQLMTSRKSVTLQAYTACCYENIARPLMTRAHQLGITHLIRGQRNAEGHRGLARDGTSLGGIQFVQPIENWTKDRVTAFVAQHMELPEHFQFEHSSMDCYDCTAFVKDSRDRVEYMKAVHPKLYEGYRVRKDAVDGAIRMALEA